MDAIQLKVKKQQKCTKWYKYILWNIKLGSSIFKIH